MAKPLHSLHVETVAFALQTGQTKTLFLSLVEASNHDDELAFSLIYRLWRDGLTDSFLTGIQDDSKAIIFNSCPKLDLETKRFYWKRTLPMDQGLNPTATYAFIVIFAVNHGLAAQVKRCGGKKKVRGKTETCDRFFVGASNKLYCSNSCATRARVQAKRKRDKEAGSL